MNKVDEILKELYQEGFMAGNDCINHERDPEIIKAKSSICEHLVASLPETIKAHTYASENAEVYRAYNAGQESYKRHCIEILRRELK